VLNAPHPARFSQGLLDPQQFLRSWYIGLFQVPWLPEFFLAWNDYQAITTIFQANAVNQTAFTPADLEAYKNAVGRRGCLTAISLGVFIMILRILRVLGQAKTLSDQA
jgi:hypothetical protein